MFAARCLAVSSSVFFLIYVVLSLAVCCVWRHIYARCGELPPRHCADLLLTLRLFPFVAASAVTAVFTVPSFLLLEPRSIEEPFGGVPLALGLCGTASALFGAANAVAGLIRSSRLIAHWTRRAKIVQAQASVPVLRIEGDAPALTAAGILRPKILLSRAAQVVLDEPELRTALRHEVAHFDRRDNLKKLMLLLVACPGMKPLETAWVEATEIAADDAAVKSASQALDLAGALIKLSQIGARTEESCHQLMTAFTHGAASLTNARIKRLIAWSDDRPHSGPHRSQQCAPRVLLAAIIAVTTTATVVLTYTQLLAQVHTATEWLVR